MLSLWWLQAFLYCVRDWQSDYRPRLQPFREASVCSVKKDEWPLWKEIKLHRYATLVLYFMQIMDFFAIRKLWVSSTVRWTHIPTWEEPHWLTKLAFPFSHSQSPFSGSFSRSSYLDLSGENKYYIKYDCKKPYLRLFICWFISRLVRNEKLAKK